VVPGTRHWYFPPSWAVHLYAPPYLPPAPNASALIRPLLIFFLAHGNSFTSRGVWRSFFAPKYSEAVLFCTPVHYNRGVFSVVSSLSQTVPCSKCYFALPSTFSPLLVFQHFKGWSDRFFNRPTGVRRITQSTHFFSSLVDELNCFFPRH